MGKKLISMAEYLQRVAHNIFQKKVKPGGRDTDRLWEVIGGEMDDARDQIVNAGEMMHPGSALGDYQDHWGECLNGMYRIPEEEDEDYALRLGNAGAFWETVGTTGFFEDWLEQIGWAAVVTVHPTRWSVRVLTLSETTGLTDCIQLVSDVYKFRSGHLLYPIELAEPLAYAGADYEYGQDDGYDTRVAVDHFLAFE